MGRRHKRFIDKRRSETYQLIYRSAAEEDASAEDRVLVEREQIHAATDKGYHSAPFLRHDPFGHFFPSEELTEAQKDEIKELGLPSDGYNYLKHLRKLGSGRAELPIPTASNKGAVFVDSKAFVAPEPETRTVDARRLTVHSEAPDEEEADAPMRSSTTRVFSHIIRQAKGAAARDVQEVDALMEKFEGMYVEEGDLLDCFVMDATNADERETLATGAHTFSKDAWIAIPDDLCSEEAALDAELGSETGEMRAKSIGRSRFSQGEMDTSSSFSERWKGMDPSDFEGRKERTRQLEVVDETFEAVLEDYDEEKIGELDDEVDDGMTLEELSRCLNAQAHLGRDGFQLENAHALRSRHQGDSDRPPKKMGEYKLLKPKKRTAAFKERDPQSLNATKNLVSSEKIGGKREEWEDVLISVRSERELDCESAWTSRTHSTLHQPTVITSIQKKQNPKPTSISREQVKISSKSGLPMEKEQEMIDGSFQGDECASDDDASQDVALHCQSRTRSETAEEKRLRKQAVKAAQKLARIRKKETKTLYRHETTRQQKHVAGMVTKNASVIEL